MVQDAKPVYNIASSVVTAMNSTLIGERIGGQGGIRTHESLSKTLRPLAGARLQPLGHLSIASGSTDYFGPNRELQYKYCTLDRYSAASIRSRESLCKVLGRHSRESGNPGAGVGLLHGKTSWTLYYYYSKQNNEKTLFTRGRAFAESSLVSHKTTYSCTAYAIIRTYKLTTESV